MSDLGSDLPALVEGHGVLAAGADAGDDSRVAVHIPYELLAQLAAWKGRRSCHDQADRRKMRAPDRTPATDRVSPRVLVQIRP